MDTQERNRLIESMFPRIKTIAQMMTNKLYRQHGNLIEFDDLLNSSIERLIKAIDTKWKPHLGKQYLYDNALGGAQDLLRAESGRKGVVCRNASLVEYEEEKHGKTNDPPFRDFIRDQNIINEVNRLPPTQKLVIFNHYFLDQTMKETANILGLSEGRVSQIESKALIRLRKRI